MGRQRFRSTKAFRHLRPAFPDGVCNDRVNLGGTDNKRVCPAAFLYALGIFVFLCFFPAIPAAQQDGQAKKGLATVRIRGSEYRVEVARTPDQQMRGLMGRTSLGRKGGMLFLFERAEIQHFWMKNTLIPLDIIFITKEMRIDSIRTMTPCRAEHPAAICQAFFYS